MLKLILRSAFLLPAFIFCTSTMAKLSLVDSGVYVGDATIIDSKVYITGTSGADLSNAIDVYFPLNTFSTDARYNRENWTVMNNKNIGGTTDLVLPRLYLDATPFAKTPYIRIDIAHNETAVRNIHAAVEKDGNSQTDYEVINLYDSQAAAMVGSANTQITDLSPNLVDSIYLRLDDICQEPHPRICLHGDTTTGDMTGTTSVDESIGIMIFADTSIYNKDDTVTVAAATTPLFFDLKLSDVIKDAPLAPTVSEVIIGDTQLTVSFNATGYTSNQLYSMIYVNTASIPTVTPVGTSTLSFLSTHKPELNPPLTTGEYTISGLQNDSEYNVSVAQINKWYFSTALSTSAAGVPLEIATFLQSQSCYFVAAGFREDHHILTFFKMFRDYFLRNYDWGQDFIRFYYKSAPRYAQIVYDSPILSKMFRGFFTFLYYLMKAMKWLALGLSLLTGFMIYRKLKLRIFIPRS